MIKIERKNPMLILLLLLRKTFNSKCKIKKRRKNYVPILMIKKRHILVNADKKRMERFRPNINDEKKN